MAIPVALIAKGLMKYGPAVYSAFKAFTGGRSHVDWNELQNFINQQHAEGSLSSQDLAAADLTQSRLNETADATGKMLTADANTRMRQRGIDSAPAAEATLARIAAQTARGRQAAGDTAQTQLYDTFMGNKQLDAAKKMALIQARLGGAQMDSYAANAERAGNINSLLQYIPNLIPKSGGATTLAVTPAAPGAAVPPPDATPSPVPDVAPTEVTPAATRMASIAGQRAGRKYKFNPANGTLGYQSRDYGTPYGAAGRMAGAMSF